MIFKYIFPTLFFLALSGAMSGQVRFICPMVTETSQGVFIEATEVKKVSSLPPLKVTTSFFTEEINSCFKNKNPGNFRGSSRRINPREKNRMGVNLDLWGPVNLGLSVDYFVSSSLNFEMGGGLNAIHVGIKYHVMGFRNSLWTPYFGAEIVYSFEVKTGLYIPGGFSYIGNNGFSFGMEFGPWIRKLPGNTTNSINGLEFMGLGALRVGYHF